MRLRNIFSTRKNTVASIVDTETTSEDLLLLSQTITFQIPNPFMRYVLSFFILVLLNATLIAQLSAPAVSNVSQKKPSTYAVIVGISTYENGITNLDFAHKDAAVFADYLKSKSGGSVPEENIRLLVNENATFAAIYDALNWLVESCQKDDLVYFYFSGHGDMENTTIYKLGFLLTYNTPRSNYINNSLRIEDLNNIANTLAVKNQAKVVLITDACHSGKLAGSENRGTFLVGDQLRAVMNKEIRITSCAPEQLSVEDEGWGGGRGVFSYYLVKGLEGLADQGRDGSVTVSEIKTYLDSALRTDPLLAEKAHRQNPVIKGVENFNLSSVDPSILDSLKKGFTPGLVQQSSLPVFKPLGIQPSGYFFNLINKKNIEDIIDFDSLNQLPKEQIPVLFVKRVVDTLQHSYFLRSEMGLTEEIDMEKIQTLEKSLINNKDVWKRFTEKMVVMLSDRGQSIINLYLEGNAAELERRRYYNAYSNGYDVYPQMFSLALKLIEPDHPLYKILKIKLHYFTGVNARLKIPTVENPKPLLDLALTELKKAQALEENAAYIQIELGILYDYLDDYEKAEKYYLRAAQISPQWVVPWSNLTGLYANTKKYDKALAASQKAIELQKDFQGTYVNTGVVYQRTGNLLMAEEMFRKSIKMNSRHFLPFEGLGYVYMNTTQYAVADSFFYEAELRKKGFHNPRLMKMPKPVLADVMVMNLNICYLDTLDVGIADVPGHFAWATDAMEQGNALVAVREFKKVIQLDPSNPLAFHYLGKLLYQQKRWNEAELLFSYAVNNFLSDSVFRLYADSLIRLLPETASKACIENRFRSHYYQRIEDHYFLAALYESWNHFSDAEQQYRKIISMDAAAVGGYYKLWMLLESIGRYKDAEDVLRSFLPQNRDFAYRELNSFYVRMIHRFPDEADNYYKAGVLLYQLAASHPNSFFYDRKKTEPDSGEEVFINLLSPSLKTDREEQANITLPGTGEVLTIAPKIVRPFTEGITFLKTADSLLAREDEQADINYKIGDLYCWQGLPERAIPHYRKSVELKPSDANTRIKLVETYTQLYYLGDALRQLDSLLLRGEINFSMQLLLAKFCIHSGRFAEAEKLLAEAKAIHPFYREEITDLNGRMHLLSGRPKEALRFYMEYLSVHPGDSLTMYTIARLYARMNNKKEAWKWLRTSIEKGFSFYWVLKQDESWNAFRKQPQWKQITGSLPVPVL